MMAYSSIAHSGYLMVGIIAMNILGLQSVAIHAFVYLVMNFLVFLVIEMLTPPAGPASIPDYSGWFRHVPVLAVLMLVGFISLTGLPPTGGFTSKMMLFSSAWYSYAEGGNKIMLWLIILGLLNTVISLFYYLRIPYYMIFREAADAPIQVPSQRNGFIGLGIFLAALIIIVFIKPDWLADMLNSLNFTYPEITE
jgi:NADH-quinone oxidoreductase subunit N